MVACKLNIWRPSTTVLSMGMEHLSLVKLLLIYLRRLTTIIRYFGGCKIQLDSTCQVFFLHRMRDFSNLCSIPGFINSYMEEVQVCVIYKTLLDSNEGDFSPHASQTIYFSNVNEKRFQVENIIPFFRQWLYQKLQVAQSQRHKIEVQSWYEIPKMISTWPWWTISYLTVVLGVEVVQAKFLYKFLF